MRKSEFEPAEVLGEIRKFFFINFENFFEQEPSGMITFAREFGRHNLRIVVTTPVIRYAKESKGFADGLLCIGFAIQHKIFGECFALRSSILIGKWEKVTKEKIDLLTELIEAAPQCPICNTITYPRQGKGRQMQYICSRHEEHACWGLPLDIDLERKLRQIVAKKY